VVEQGPEEPCVPSSNLGGATKEILSSFDGSISFLAPIDLKKLPYLCIIHQVPTHAGVAQLLERILAKDEVQG
jgi:hypothetical protein